MLAFLVPLGIAVALVALNAYLDARAARRPYERALAELTQQERDERFLARVTQRTEQRVDRANRNRGEG
jgi:hypothetical protein